MWDWFIDFWKYGDYEGWFGVKPEWRCSCCGWKNNDHINFVEKENSEYCPSCGAKIVDKEVL